MSNNRKKKRGFLLKREFCGKYNITMVNFNKTLLEKGFLVHHVISYKKHAFGIGNNCGLKILPLHGSNQQGTFQYSEKFLREVFDIDKKTPFNPENYRINFGMYKGKKLIDMTSDDEIKYCMWVMNSFFKDDTENEKSLNEIWVAFNWFLTKNIDLVYNIVNK